MFGVIRNNRLLNFSGLNTSDVSKCKYQIPNQHVESPRVTSTVVWLEDIPRAMFFENNARLYAHMQSNGSNPVLYSDITKCIEYLKQALSCDYVIVVIISYSIDIMQEIIHHLRQYHIFPSIFIVSSERNTSDCFSSSTDDISVFQDKQSMLDCLEPFIDDIRKDNLEGCLFTSSQKEKTWIDMHQEPSACLWMHIFKILLTCMLCDSPEAKQQMLDKCRAFYRNNPAQLRYIDEFQNKYEPSDAIYWYTRSGFLFNLVNKALRSANALALYSFRYFINALYSRIKEVPTIHFYTKFRLYRGARIYRDEVKNLKVQSTVVNTSFFSCSRDPTVAKAFIGIDPSTGRTFSCDKNEKVQYVFYEIDVDLTKFPNTEVADVYAHSEFENENEMVFMLGSIFIINSIEYVHDKCLWVICMSSICETTENDHKYETYIHRRLLDTSSLMLFGHALVSIKGDYMHSKDYFYRLLETLPVDDPDRSVIYYDLGRIYRSLEKYEKALACFRGARLLLRRLLPERMFDYCRTLGGIGNVYSRQGHSEQAINVLKQVITLHSKCFLEDHTEIPFDFNRLGYAYFKAKDFENALIELSKADAIFKYRVCINHQGHAETFHTLGLVYRALGDEEQSYNYFNEALQMRHALLNKDHPDIASSYYQLSLIHQDRGEYETALQYATRSLGIRSSKLPHYHNKLKGSLELVKRLRQRHNVFQSHF